ncbi:imidazolonepropionase [Vicingaceae bacterium]|nr:imidazolonepropionase [Vicingaceae bacterium]
MDQPEPDSFEKLLTGYQLITMRPDGSPYGLIENGAIGVRDGKIAWIGRVADAPASDSIVVEGDGRFLSPGLIDCHTHLVYGGCRADEWEMRLGGATYEDIARAGGGILSTVAATRAASEQELFDSSAARARRLLSEGVTTIEIKSGYGLDTETELKMLRVVNRIADELPLSVSRTMLGAHAIPPEFEGRADDYVDLVCKEMIPAAKTMCDSVDVFCESIAFDMRQTEKVLRAAIDHGLNIKIHAEQLTTMGGAGLAAELGALSADHLEYVDESCIVKMSGHGTVATLLPGAYYFLRETKKPPMELFDKHRVSVAIATDCNPGSSPVVSLLLMTNFACTLFGMNPCDALAGVTRSAAAALGMAPSIGTLEVGKDADFAVWDISSPAELAYGIGHNPCRQVFKNGDLVVER